MSFQGKLAKECGKREVEKSLKFQMVQNLLKTLIFIR